MTHGDSAQRGAALIMIMVLVGLLGLVAGGAMLSTGDTLLDTVKQGDESMQASTLGTGRGVSEDSSDGPSKLALANSQAAKSQSVTPPQKDFWDAALNVATSYLNFVPSSAEETSVYGQSTLGTVWTGVVSTVEGVWELGKSSAKYTIDQDYREQQNDKLVTTVVDALSNPAETLRALADGIETVAGQIEIAVHDADRIVDYGSGVERAELYGQVSGTLLTTVLSAVGGGAVARVAKASRAMPSTALPRSKVSPPKKIQVSPIRPLLSADLRRQIDELSSVGDSFAIPKGTNKDGLLAYLSTKDVEHAVVRTKSGELRVILGDENTVHLSDHDPKRLLFHNHPGEAGPFISGNSTLALNYGGGDLATMRQGFPKQRSTIIGTTDGTYRNRIPTTADLERNVAPPLEGSIIGGTGRTDTAIIGKRTEEQRSLNEGMRNSELKPNIPPLGMGTSESRLAASAGRLPDVKWKSQSQDAHTPGTAANINRKKQGKVTSEFFGRESGRHATLIALQRGKPVLNRKGVPIDGVVEYDFGTAIGTGPNGGVFTKVKAKTDSKGRVHGHPSGQELMVGRDKKLVPWRQALEETPIKPIFQAR